MHAPSREGDGAHTSTRPMRPRTPMPRLTGQDWVAEARARLEAMQARPRADPERNAAYLVCIAHQAHHDFG